MPADRLAAELADVVQLYPAASGTVAAVRGISAEFPRGSVAVVMGPSGAGKSTLLRLLACLERPAAGEVLIAGSPTSTLTGRARRRLIARHIGYVFQRPSHNLLGHLAAAHHVDLAWQLRTGAGSAAAVDELLATAGLGDVADARPADLTPGEQQRLAFAMAVAASPALVVADEPTAELDPDGAAALVALLPTLVRRGQTFVLASHDPAVVAVADHVLVIRRGTLAAYGRGDDLVAAIDDAGRLALPDDVLAALHGRGARVTPVDPAARTGYRIAPP